MPKVKPDVDSFVDDNGVFCLEERPHPDMYKYDVLDIYSKFHRPIDPGITFDPAEGETQQSFKDECDINRIVSQYVKTGTWSGSLRPPTRVPQFGDFSNVLEYQESMNKIIEAQEAFDSLPSRVRQRFQNDPAQLLAFLDDVSNQEEAIKLGLIPDTKTGTDGGSAAGVPEPKTAEPAAAGS